MSIFVVAALGLDGCGGKAAATNNAIPSPPQYLAGKGTKWRVVIRDPKAGNMTGLALDGHGDIYVAEISGDRIVEYSVDGKLIRKFGTHGSGPGQLINPAKVTVDSQGSVYVSDIGNNRVQKFTAGGRPLAQWGGLEASSEAGKFSFPIGIAVDPQGDVFVVDANNYRIQKLSPQGSPLIQWTSQGTEPPPLRLPYDIALDAKGDVYVSYVHGNDGVEKFSAAGRDVGRLGGSGSGPGEFSTPTGMAIDGAGNVFVLDTGNNRIQELSESGQYIGEWPGPTSRPFFLHSEMAMDNTGNVYVSDDNIVLRLCVRSTPCG